MTMDKPRAFIHWKSHYDFAMGVLVIGRFRLPVLVPVILSGAYLIIALIGAAVWDSVVEGSTTDGLHWFLWNLLYVGGVWAIVGAIVGAFALWRMVQDANEWSSE